MNKTSISITTIQRYDELIKSLRDTGITTILHCMTFGKSEVSTLGSNQNMVNFYRQNKIPRICSDESGRTLADGIYLDEVLHQSYQNCAILIPLMRKIGYRCGQNMGHQSLHIMKREFDCQHFYSIFMDVKRPHFLHWLINNGSFLHELIENYNFKFRDIILEAKSIESRVHYPNYNEFDLLDHELIMSDLYKTIISVVHKDLNTPIYLAPQQRKCLSLLNQKKSAKQIAKEMQLSHRTVEHYLENLRKLLGCASSQEIIDLYGDQLINFQ